MNIRTKASLIFLHWSVLVLGVNFLLVSRFFFSTKWLSYAIKIDLCIKGVFIG